MADLPFSELEREIWREACSVALNRLIENMGRDAVEAGEVGVETKRDSAEVVAQTARSREGRLSGCPSGQRGSNDAVAAEAEDAGGDGVGGLGHGGQVVYWLQTAAHVARDGNVGGAPVESMAEFG